MDSRCFILVMYPQSLSQQEIPQSKTVYNALSGYVMGWWWTMINRSTLSTNYINHHRRSTMKYKPWKLKLETLQKWDDVLGRYTILTGKTTYLRSKIPTWKMILHFSKNKLPRSFGNLGRWFSIFHKELICFAFFSFHVGFLEVQGKSPGGHEQKPVFFTFHWILVV